jgi:hypothetical protein
MKYNHYMDDKNYTSSYIPLSLSHHALGPLIHTSPVICKLDIEYSFDWVCNFMNGILSQGLFTIAYIYKC